MSSSLRIEKTGVNERATLLPIVDAGFTGLYRRHARSTLQSVRWVMKATRSGRPVGLAMCTTMGRTLGYIYYVIVIPSERGKGVGGFLLDDALQRLQNEGAREVFASVRVDNVPSNRLFQSRGFARTSFRGVAGSRGVFHALGMWRRMVVVPSERVLAKVLLP